MASDDKARLTSWTNNLGSMPLVPDLQQATIYQTTRHRQKNRTPLLGRLQFPRMAYVHKSQVQIGGDSVKDHPDFQAAWIKKLLSDLELRWTAQVPRRENTTNAMFEKILAAPDCIRAHCSFTRPTQEPDSTHPFEQCFLMSIGSGVDGKTGRAHGGFDALVLDQICGSCAHHAQPDLIPPATATMTTDYKLPVSTPCVILARSWMIEMSGRKMWIKAVMEDSEGRVLAAAKTLFIRAKEVDVKL